MRKIFVCILLLVATGIVSAEELRLGGPDRPYLALDISDTGWVVLTNPALDTLWVVQPRMVQPVFLYAAPKVGRIARLSPDGNFLVSEEEIADVSRKKERINAFYLPKLEYGWGLRLAGAISPRWATDRRIGFLTEQGLMIVDPTGRVLSVKDPPKEGFSAPCLFLPDGSGFLVNVGGAFRRVDMKKGPDEPLVADAKVIDAEISPDGKACALLTGEGQLYLVDLASSKSEKIATAVVSFNFTSDGRELAYGVKTGKDWKWQRVDMDGKPVNVDANLPNDIVRLVRGSARAEIRQHADGHVTILRGEK